MSPMRDGQTTNDERTREDRATQPNGCWMAEFRNFKRIKTTYKKVSKAAEMKEMNATLAAIRNHF